MSVRISVAHTGRYFDRDWAVGEVAMIDDPVMAERMLRLVDQVGMSHVRPFRLVEETPPAAESSATGGEPEAPADGDANGESTSQDE